MVDHYKRNVNIKVRNKVHISNGSIEVRDDHSISHNNKDPHHKDLRQLKDSYLQVLTLMPQLPNNAME